MPLGLFGAVQTYPQMLRKIGIFSFIFAVFAVYHLRSQIPSLNEFLKPYTFGIPILKVPIPFGVFFPAFLFALVSRIIKLHDRVSDLLRLRVRFDTRHILLPMAEASGASNPNITLQTLIDRRRELMNGVFYKYASSTPGKAVIDTHYVTMAIDQWSWFWIVQEAVFIAIIIGLILLTAGKVMSTLIPAAIMGLGIAFLVYIWKGCRNYAAQEIGQILDNPRRKKKVAEVFNAL